MTDQETNSSSVPPIDTETADAGYRPFPSFAEWSTRPPRLDLWLEAQARLEVARKESTPEHLDQAFRFVMRAAALDTGAIEGLYEVDRGFTYSVAAQDAAWETKMDERGPSVRPLFEAQLHAYELVLDAATQKTPIVEVWIRRLHEEVTAAQETYRVLTDLGWDERPLPRGKYKTTPNHVLLTDGSVHSYAPVAETAPEMARLVEQLQSAEFAAADPIVQAAYAHYALVVIHPFSDGNGRVARALASVYLYRDGAVPLLVFADRKPIYLDALHSADSGDYFPFTSFVQNAAISAVSLVVDNLRAAQTSPIEDTVRRLADLVRAQAELTHTDMDQVANALSGHVFSALEGRRAGLAPLPSGVQAVVQNVQAEPPPRELFRPSRANPRLGVQPSVHSAAPADGSAMDRFYVLVSTGRDTTESLVVVREGDGEEWKFALDEVYPDLSLTGHARLDALAERAWSELFLKLEPQMEQSLRNAGYVT